MHCEAKQTKMWGLDVLVYCRAMERDGLVVPPKPQNPRRISANNIFVVYFKKLIAQIHTTYECCCSVTQSCPNLWTACPTCPWTTAHQASLSFTISQSLLKLTSTESVMPSNHLIFRCPLLLLPSIFLSIRVFFNESALCIWQNVVHWRREWQTTPVFLPRENPWTVKTLTDFY